MRTDQTSTGTRVDHFGRSTPPTPTCGSSWADRGENSEPGETHPRKRRLTPAIRELQRGRISSDVAAHCDLPDSQREPVADERHTHWHDPASCHSTQDTADEEHRQVGSEGRRNKTKRQDGGCHLNQYGLSDCITRRSEKRLAETER